MRTFGAYAIKERKLAYPYELLGEYKKIENITIRNQLAMLDIQHVDCADANLRSDFHTIHRGQGGGKGGELL